MTRLPGTTGNYICATIKAWRRVCGNRRPLTAFDNALRAANGRQIVKVSDGGVPIGYGLIDSMDEALALRYLSSKRAKRRADMQSILARMEAFA